MSPVAVAGGAAAEVPRTGEAGQSILSALSTNPAAVAGFCGVVFFVVLGIIGAFSARHGILPGDSAASILQPPSRQHLLGTDELGRDVLVELMAGTGVSLVVGFGAGGIAVGVGAITGIVSGYFGGLIETALMRLTDIMLALPSLPLLIVLASVVGQGLENIVLVIGLTAWPSTARLIRSQVLSLRERTFVVRCRSVGVPPVRLMRVHIAPQLVPLIVANGVLITAGCVLSEASLTFLGLGDITQPSWGRMLEGAFTSGAVLRGALWYVLPPGIAILLLVLSLSLLGHALVEEWDLKRNGGLG